MRMVSLIPNAKAYCDCSVKGHSHRTRFDVEKRWKPKRNMAVFFKRTNPEASNNKKTVNPDSWKIGKKPTRLEFATL